MKRTVLAVTFLAAMSFSVERYSRDDIWNHAFEYSEKLAEVRAEQENAVYMRKEYVGKAFPDISAAFNYQHAPETYSPFDGIPVSPGTPDMSSLFPEAKKNTFQWGVNATQPIFAQGKVITGLKIADVYKETVEMQYREAQFSLAQNITNMYNQALLAQQGIYIQSEALTIAQESHRLSLARFSAGRGSALDTLNTRYSQQEALLRFHEAQKNHRLALRSLAVTASLDVDTMVLTDSLKISEMPLTEAEAWDEMQSRNATLKLLDVAQEMQMYQTKLVKTDYLPSVAGGVSAGQINQLNNLDQSRWGWDIKLFAGVQVPLFNGGQRSAKVRQAELAEYKIEQKAIDAKNNLRLALGVAFEELSVAKEELIQIEDMIALTEQGLKISKLSYELGQVTLLELNQSEQNYRTAKLAYNNGIFKLNSAVTSINKFIENPALIAVQQ